MAEGEGDGVGVLVVDGTDVYVAVGLDVAVGDEVCVGLGDGVGVQVRVGVAVGMTPGWPGFGLDWACQSAAVFVSRSSGVRASDWPAGTGTQGGSKAEASLP